MRHTISLGVERVKWFCKYAQVVIGQDLDLIASELDLRDLMTVPHSTVQVTGMPAVHGILIRLDSIDISKEGLTKGTVTAADRMTAK